MYFSQSRAILFIVFCMRCSGETLILSVGVLPLSSYFGPERETALIETEIKFGYLLGDQSVFFNVPNSAVLTDFKCGHTKATAVYTDHQCTGHLERHISST